MKTNIFIYLFLLIAYLFFAQDAKAENIHFNNDIYILKTSIYSSENKGFENEYYLGGNNNPNWGKKIGIYYYSEIKDPIKFALAEDKKIESNTETILLKFIANKKQNKALLSYINSGEENDLPYFEHNIYKYEPHPTKGIMVLKYTKRYFPKTNEDATNIAQEIKATNDDLMEQLIISPIPPIVEKEIE